MLQERLVDKVIGRVRERHMQSQYVASEASAARSEQAMSAGGGLERVVRQHAHAERGGQLTHSPPDPPVPDDAHRRAVQAAYPHLSAVGPAAATHQVGQLPKVLYQMKASASTSSATARVLLP